MNLKSLITNKKGGYIVDAAITLPILIICICTIILLIRIIATCENVTFITSKHLINTTLSYYNELNKISLCTDIKNETNISNFRITEYRYLFDKGDETDLISFKAEAIFSVDNPIGIDKNIKFKESVLCRGFTGTLKEFCPLDQEEFEAFGKAELVFVFPKYGERYHNEKCKYITQNNKEEIYILKMDREDAFRKGFTPCMICQGAAYE